MSGATSSTASEDHVARAAVDRDRLPLAHLVPGDPDEARVEIDVQRLAAGDARLAHPACHDGRVRGHAAVRGEHARGLDQPVDVVRGRLPADEDHRLVLALLGGRVRVEHDLPGRGPRRRVEPLRDDVVVRVRVEPRMEELVELAGVDARDRLLLRDQALLAHRHGGVQGRRGRPLGRARLEEVEHAVLDRELDVLHVAVMALESAHRPDQLGVRVREDLLHALERLRGADAGDHVLALRVHEELAVHALLAGRRVAGEAHAGGGAVALVAEDHLDDVHRSAEVVRDVVRAAVHLRARRLPRVEHGADGAAQLLARVLRERASELLLVDRLEGRDEAAQVVLVEVGVLRDALGRLQLGERRLEAVRVDPVDDLAVHLDQPPVRVEREAGVPGRAGEALHRRVVQPEVEDRVHHPGHGDRRAGADGHEQRPLGVAEAEPAALLEAADVSVHLLVETGRDVVRDHVRAARVGRDREARRDGDSELCHLCEPDALAPEELATAVGRLLEAVDVPGGGGDVGHRTDLS